MVPDESGLGVTLTMVDHDEVPPAHRTLLAMAGQVPDDVLAAARLRLAEGRAGDRLEPSAPGAAHSFSATVDPEGPALLDLTGDDLDPVDRAAAEAAGRMPEATALWRSWRAPAPWDPAGAGPTRVYVLEVTAAAALPRLTAIVMQALTAAGLSAPQVETYPAGFELPPYQSRARGCAALIWTAHERTPIRLARVFDRGGAAGVGFDPGHELLSGVERDRVAGYLEAGEPILVTTRTATDVLSPERGPVVPTSFRTDGVWVWTETVTYYLQEHSLAPDRDLLGHIRAREFAPAEVDAAAEHRALAMLLTRA